VLILINLYQLCIRQKVIRNNTDTYNIIVAITAGDNLVRQAMSQLNLSARGYHRVLKLARTISDLAGSDDIQSVHLAEALQYRPKLMLR